MIKFSYLMLFLFFGVVSTYAQTEVYSSTEVESLPVIGTCEDAKADCFQDNLNTYIQQNIDIRNLVSYASAKAYAQFVITKSGEISDIKIRSTNEDIKNEANRLLTNLKVQSPATINGEACNMIFTTPIYFNRKTIDGTGKSLKMNSGPTKSRGAKLSFEDAAVQPTFKECLSSNNEKCFEDVVSMRIKNFLSSSKALKNEVLGGNKIKVYFEIQPNGKLSDAIIICKNEKIMRELTKFINNMTITEAAKDENGSYIRTYFLKRISI